MSKWSGLQQIANVAAKITLLISIWKKPVSNFATKRRLIYYSLSDCYFQMWYACPQHIESIA